MSGPLTRYWIGRPTGGPMSRSFTRASVPTKPLAADRPAESARSRSRASRSLVTMIDLPEGRGRRLDVEGQHETRRALADIGRPAVDIGIADELFLFELLHLRLGLGNRAVLRQGPVDDQLRAGRRTGRTAAATKPMPKSDRTKTAPWRRSSPSASACRPAGGWKARVRRPGFSLCFFIVCRAGS